MIDDKAYGGVDIRANVSLIPQRISELLVSHYLMLHLLLHLTTLQLAHELRAKVNKANARVVDLCCGVGMSTRALESAFHDAEFLVG